MINHKLINAVTGDEVQTGDTVKFEGMEVIVFGFTPPMKHTKHGMVLVTCPGIKGRVWQKPYSYGLRVIAVEES